jgi:integrase
MARVVGRLSAVKVSKAKEPGKYPDGGGLYLQVTGDGAKSWIYRFMLGGRERQMGLGPLSAVGLADARTKAAECRALRQDGIDPIEARKATREQAALDAARTTTFKEAAMAYIGAHKAGWRNSKHVSQWAATLETYAHPTIGSLSVQAVDTAMVLKILEPIWSAKPETASRVRMRIENILDWAAVRGYRKGENPARWRGHLDHLLPAKTKVRRVEHHAALPYAELPDFLKSLRKHEGTAARALEFTILTAARTGEAIGAQFDEFDIDAAMWIVPDDRMKSGREHRVPLTQRAADIVSERRAKAEGPHVFPGQRPAKPISNMAMAMVLRRMGRSDITVHGFRSTFRDWAAERTNFPNEVVEMALAHAVEDKVEAAYRRGDLLDKRRRLMDAWGEYCNHPASPTAAIVPIRNAIKVVN